MRFRGERQGDVFPNRLFRGGRQEDVFPNRLFRGGRQGDMFPNRLIRSGRREDMFPNRQFRSGRLGDMFPNRFFWEWQKRGTCSPTATFGINYQFLKNILTIIAYNIVHQAQYFKHKMAVADLPRWGIRWGRRSSPAWAGGRAPGETGHRCHRRRLSQGG